MGAKEECALKSWMEEGGKVMAARWELELECVCGRVGGWGG